MSEERKRDRNCFIKPHNHDLIDILYHSLIESRVVVNVVSVAETNTPIRFLNLKKCFQSCENGIAKSYLSRQICTFHAKTMNEPFCQIFGSVTLQLMMTIIIIIFESFL